MEHVDELTHALTNFFHNDIYYNEHENAWYDDNGLLCRGFFVETMLSTYEALTVAYFMAQMSLGRK